MAATNINRVVLTGNLTRDPELRSLPSGMSVCSLRIASNTRRKDQSGEWMDKPNYFSVTVWGAQGENCARFLSKGRPVALDGRLEWREWQGQDGAKRESVEIVADSVQFLGGRELLEQLDHNLKITDGVLRFRIIKLRPGTPAPPDLRAQAAVTPETAEAS